MTPTAVEYCAERSRPDLPAWQGVALAAAAAATAALLYVVDPARSSILPPCPLHALTGLYCPGCGTTRGLHELLHGHLWAALDRNALMVVLLPPLAYALLVRAAERLGGWRLPTRRIPGRWIWCLLGVIVLYGVLRNLPCYPFSILAP